ncbi:MAG: RNA polymerase sigma factor [Solirubrobacteraceae bacterium]
MSPKLPARLLAAQSDRRLVEMVGAGNERAFDVLVQRYRRQLLRYCGRLGLSEARAEDVLQHAFLQAWLALERGAEVRELKPWLYRVAHNAAVNAMRSSARDHGKAVEVESLDVAAVEGSELERRIAVREALTDVAALPPMQREAILMSAVDGRSHREVASALGVSDGAVRGLLYRARTTLRGAAAALTPQPLLGWISGGASRVATSAGKLVEVSSAAGGSELGSVLMKGAAVAATTAVAAGVVLTPTHHGGGAGRPHKLASSGVARVGIQRSSSVTISDPRGVGGGSAGQGQRRLILGSAVRRTHAHGYRALEPSGARHHGDKAEALSIPLPTRRHSGGRGQGTSDASSGSDGRSGGGGPAEGSSQDNGGGGGSGASAPPSGGAGGGSPPREESTHGGTGGEHEDGGSTEDKAEAAAETAEREAEAARERTERESEEAREREAEGHGGGSGQDS